MERKIFNKYIFYLLLLGSSTLYGNVVWPALFVGSAIFSSLFLVIISIAIEAIALYLFIKSISPQKALFISIVGNAASALLGTIIMAIAMIGWHLSFDRLLGGTLSIYNIIASYILMYLGSSLIELFTIKKIFRYSTKQLLVPILIGNAITYAMVGIYKFPQETKQVKEFIGIHQPDEKIISKNKRKKN